jgi:hypothetical protein
MSFNIIAETSARLDYDKIHRAIFKDDLLFELVPMPTLGLNGGDAVGICVPLKNATEATWQELNRVLKILRTKFQCDVYELYGGEKLGYFNSGVFKKNLIR